MHQVSSQQTSPRDDLNLSVCVTYNKKSQFPINSVKKACRMYNCQVFYHKEGFNYWKTTLKFFPIKNVSKYNIGRYIGTCVVTHIKCMYSDIQIHTQTNYHVLCLWHKHTEAQWQILAFRVYLCVIMPRWAEPWRHMVVVLSVCLSVCYQHSALLTKN